VRRFRKCEAPANARNIKAMIMMPQGGSTLDPYAVLGVKPGASAEEIHAAYREAAQKFHPDKVSHLGEDFQILAQTKIRRNSESL
jgi:DnaJ-class molecular chaperone